MRMTRSAIVLLIIALAAPLLSGAEPQERGYVVSLKPAQAADDPRAVAAELMKLYGGRLAEQGSAGQAFVMHLSESRARLVAADPRVQSVVPLTPAPAANEPQEVVPWTSGVAYTYDGSGNIRQIGKDTFVYDHVGRLIRADVNGVRRDYEYDAYGNRTKCIQGKGTAEESDCQGYSIDPGDNHIAEAQYDPAGAGTVTSLGTHNYSYDEFLMLRRDQSAEVREFVYTASDERIAVYHAGSKSWRWMIRDESNKLLREFASSGGAYGTATFSWKKDYVWRDKLLLATVQAEGAGITRYHYHLDHLGTARRITDSSDNLVGFHDYFAFGPKVVGGKDEPSLTALRYTGHERDEAGDPFGTLDYMHARYYNPALGRFLSLDPKRGKPQDPQSWNRYAYALNNPIRSYDPDGKQTMDYRILHVRVNIVYSNVDNKGFLMGSTLRERVEAGTVRARHLFGHLGIAVSFHRYNGDIKVEGDKLAGKVQTEKGEVEVNSFLKANYGNSLTVVASQDFYLKDSKGGTNFANGVPVGTVLARNASSGTLAHELAHALGNRLSEGDKPVWGENFLTDRLWDLEVLQYDMGVGFSMEFESWLREGAENLGCDWGHDC